MRPTGCDQPPRSTAGEPGQAPAMAVPNSPAQRSLAPPHLLPRPVCRRRRHALPSFGDRRPNGTRRSLIVTNPAHPIRFRRVISAMSQRPANRIAFCIQRHLRLSGRPQFGFVAPFPLRGVGHRDRSSSPLAMPSGAHSSRGVRSPGDQAALRCPATVQRAAGHLRHRPPTGAFPPCGTSPLATDGTVGGSAPPPAGENGAGGEQTIGKVRACRPIARIHPPRGALV